MFSFLQRIKKFGGGRVSYVSEAIQKPVNKILDIGCSYGWALEKLTDKADQLWGIDTDLEALSLAEQSYPNVQFIHQTAANLPFDNGTFDVVILSEVIEHVGDENKQLVIDEAWRVLKENGLFIFTAPYEGLFAWADHLDFKRRFPSIYRAYMRISHYNPKTPIEIGHKHLSLDEMNQLFNDRFTIDEIQFCGLFMPFIHWILVLGSRLKLLPHSLENQLNRLQDWESGIQYPRFLAYNIRLKAYKNPVILKNKANQSSYIQA